RTRGLAFHLTDGGLQRFDIAILQRGERFALLLANLPHLPCHFFRGGGDGGLQRAASRIFAQLLDLCGPQPGRALVELSLIAFTDLPLLFAFQLLFVLLLLKRRYLALLVFAFALRSLASFVFLTLVFGFYAAALVLLPF